MLDAHKPKSERLIRSSLSVFMFYTPPISIRTATYPHAYTCGFHYHDYPQVWYCREGIYTHETEYGEYLCGPGTVFVVPPGVLHNFRAPEEGGVTLIQMDLTFDYLANVSFDSAPHTAATLFLPPFFRKLGSPCKELYALSEASQAVIEDVLSTLSFKKTNEQTKRLAVERLFSLPEFALSDVQQEKASEIMRTRFYPVMRALSYMHANCSHKITAEKLCEISSLCRTHFFTYVNEYLGISYSIYLIMIRVTRANIALVHTNYSLSYISDMCGFTTRSYMSKCYKKYKGIYPKTDRANQIAYQNKYSRLYIGHDFFL